MKKLLVLFLALVALTAGVMLTEGFAKTIFQYGLFGVSGVVVFVLITGLAD